MPNQQRKPFVILSQDESVTCFETLSGQPPAFIDTSDVDLVSKFRFFPQSKGDGPAYLRAHIRDNGQKKSIQLHNLILGPDLKIKTWANGNRFDCRRSNLLSEKRTGKTSSAASKSKAKSKAKTKRSAAATQTKRRYKLASAKPNFGGRPLINGSICQTLEQICKDGGQMGINLFGEKEK